MVHIPYGVHNRIGYMAPLVVHLVLKEQARLPCSTPDLGCEGPMIACAHGGDSTDHSARQLCRK